MFTGIVEETGKITRIEPVACGINLTVAAGIILEDVKLGDSISINGACHTVISFTETTFTVEVSSETLKVTTLGNLKVGDSVNLERALKLTDRLGGHLVNGHVDSIGELVEITQSGISKILTFKAPAIVMKYLVHKGSVCIDGISLTVCKLSNSTFSVTIIPHTFEHTNLLNKKLGQKVNLEVDIIAKYVEKLLNRSIDNDLNDSKLTYGFLLEHGFA